MNAQPEPNYWVDLSITGDGTWVVGSTRDGGIVEGADSKEEAGANLRGTQRATVSETHS